MATRIPISRIALYGLLVANLAMTTTLLVVQLSETDSPSLETSTNAAQELDKSRVHNGSQLTASSKAEPDKPSSESDQVIERLVGKPPNYRGRNSAGHWYGVDGEYFSLRMTMVGGAGSGTAWFEFGDGREEAFHRGDELPLIRPVYLEAIHAGSAVISLGEERLRIRTPSSLDSDSLALKRSEADAASGIKTFDDSGEIPGISSFDEDSGSNAGKGMDELPGGIIPGIEENPLVAEALRREREAKANQPKSVNDGAETLSYAVDGDWGAFVETVRVSLYNDATLRETPMTAQKQGIRILAISLREGSQGASILARAFQLRAGDVIVGINGIRINKAAELWSQVQNAASGKDLTITYLRDTDTSNPQRFAATAAP